MTNELILSFSGEDLEEWHKFMLDYETAMTDQSGTDSLEDSLMTQLATLLPPEPSDELATALHQTHVAEHGWETVAKSFYNAFKETQALSERFVDSAPAGMPLDRLVLDDKASSLLDEWSREMKSLPETKAGRERIQPQRDTEAFRKALAKEK